ncbi:MAG: lysine-sensitive aspartokinase 3 [Bryobacterales bacterium]|nr:lysine-sensitive aspartokinase 3 [Acidobacteriota bacterium]MCB9384709.1 lysine-sensitive aspartokinase 3 [Bryobacterales bacterium]
MIVMKFGGTSVESAAALERISGIVASRRSRRPIVVVSAMGKTTDRLLTIARAAVHGDSEVALRLLEELRAFHVEHARAVCPDKKLGELRAFLDEHFHELTALVKGLVVLGELTPRSIDAISAFGERLSSYIVSLAFQSQGMDSVRVDSRDVMVTDGRHTAAAPQLELTQQRLQAHVAPLVAEGKVVVMGGFIASSEDGATTTLGRGGSDYSASLIGALLDAEEVEIWTDVDGVMTADPSMVEDAHRIRVMTFAEAAELAYFGARVLHPSTMAPAVEKNIPIRVLNSRRPEVEGTEIVLESKTSETIIKSIAYKEHITVVDIRSTRMLMAHGFLARIFDVFEKYETAVDMVATSEVSVSLTVDRTDRLDQIVAELGGVAEVSRRNGQAIVCVVGEGIRHTRGVSAKIFSALADIQIGMIALGASRLNVTFVVEESDLEEVVRRLHQTFFSTVDPAVFA